MFKNLIITCFLGLIAIVLGAFGAHALKDVLSSSQLSSFETGVRYQMYHAIVLLFVNIFDGFTTAQRNKISFIFFLGILFCTIISIYGILFRLLRIDLLRLKKQSDSYWLNAEQTKSDKIRKQY
mgnify:CR=1 FL=1